MCSVSGATPIQQRDRKAAGRQALGQHRAHDAGAADRDVNRWSGSLSLGGILGMPSSTALRHS